MKCITIAFALLFVCLSCGNKEVSTQEVEIVSVDDSTAQGKEFEMYQMSEMSLLMEQMFVDHQRLREQIINGEDIGEYPKHYDDIHTAELTVASDRDLFFDEKANEFITAHKLIFEPNVDKVSRFNQSVDACIECHTVKCGGPISRIKKLFLY